MKKILLTLMALGAVSSLTACGPQQSAADKDRQQVDEEVAQQRAVIMPFVGVYSGTLTEANGTVDTAQLSLAEQDMLVSNPSRNEASTVPTLEGSLNICLHTKDCFNQLVKGKTAQEKELAQEDIFNIGQFNIAKFDAPTSMLILSFGAGSNSSSPGPTSTYGTVLLNMKVSGANLSGNVSTTVRPNYGQLSVTRAN